MLFYFIVQIDLILCAFTENDVIGLAVRKVLESVLEFDLDLVQPFSCFQLGGAEKNYFLFLTALYQPFNCSCFRHLYVTF